jgi:hypothetical protein
LGISFEGELLIEDNEEETVCDYMRNTDFVIGTILVVKKGQKEKSINRIINARAINEQWDIMDANEENIDIRLLSKGKTSYRTAKDAVLDTGSELTMLKRQLIRPFRKKHDEVKTFFTASGGQFSSKVYKNMNLKLPGNTTIVKTDIVENKQNLVGYDFYSSFFHIVDPRNNVHRYIDY